MLRKLKIYAGPEHPHAAQMPSVLDVPGARRQPPAAGRVAG
jgi:ribosomal protein L13